MTVLQLRRDTRAAVTAEALRDELLSGTIKPGTPLDGDELAARAGMTVATVREALAELARDGLVVHSLHRGVEVTPITRDDVRDIYAARRAFESAGLDALLRRRPVDVRRLGAATERMGEAAVAGDCRAAVAADMAFHLGLVAAAGSRHLTAAAQAALRELRLVLSVADRTAGDLPALAADHAYLVDVFRARRPRAAAVALEEHLARGEALAAAAAP